MNTCHTQSIEFFILLNIFTWYAFLMIRFNHEAIVRGIVMIPIIWYTILMFVCLYLIDNRTTYENDAYGELPMLHDVSYPNSSHNYTYYHDNIPTNVHYLPHDIPSVVVHLETYNSSKAI